MTLNERANRLADHMAATAANLRIDVSKSSSGARILDCGVKATGGLQAGLALARICLAGQADVSIVPGDVAGVGCPTIQVSTDIPVVACMASQYAGWQITVDGFFAMGSGPMRAAYGKEALFDTIPGREQTPVAVGCLETGELPPDPVLQHISDAVSVPTDKLTVLTAPASSIAGSFQVVARSVETALHKMHELKFDLAQILSGFGAAPLPPIANNELHAIGKTNDAILYGGRVVLWVQSDDDYLADIGPKIPSIASPDHGEPFAAIFDRYDHDFYKIDPMLFSPAEVVFVNLTSGKTHVFGRVMPEILYRSFFETA